MWHQFPGSGYKSISGSSYQISQLNSGSFVRLQAGAGVRRGSFAVCCSGDSPTPLCLVHTNSPIFSYIFNLLQRCFACFYRLHFHTELHPDSSALNTSSLLYVTYCRMNIVSLLIVIIIIIKTHKTNGSTQQQKSEKGRKEEWCMSIFKQQKQIVWCVTWQMLNIQRSTGTWGTQIGRLQW